MPEGRKGKFGSRNAEFGIRNCFLNADNTDFFSEYGYLRKISKIILNVINN
jgi:hypothetical protein